MERFACPPLNEDECEFVFRRALELREAARSGRAPNDVFAALEELGVEPIHAQRALAELQAYERARRGEPPPPRRGPRHALRALAGIAAVTAAALTFVAWRQAESAAESANRYILDTTEQVIERQESFRREHGRYTARLEELGTLAAYDPDGSVELIGGGGGYLAHIEATRTSGWCQVRGALGREPVKSCEL